MKKIIFILVLTAFFVSNACALETDLLGLYNKIIAESKEIKLLMKPGSADMLLISSMWDSCIVAKTQLDAYFHMLTIFNTVREEEFTKEAATTLANWLEGIKKTNSLNIKSLNSATRTVTSDTKVYADRLKTYFTDLNSQIDMELRKISILEKSAKAR